MCPVSQMSTIAINVIDISCHQIDDPLFQTTQYLILYAVVLDIYVHIIAKKVIASYIVWKYTPNNNT